MACALRKGEGVGARRAAAVSPSRDPLSVARAAIKAEANRWGLGEDYDAEADAAGIAAVLSEALAIWRHERGVDVSSQTPATAPTPLAAASSFSTVCARWMRCPACGGNDSFVIGLPDGPVLALSEDLTYTYASADEEAHATALCGCCGHEGSVGAFS